MNRLNVQLLLMVLHNNFVCLKQHVCITCSTRGKLQTNKRNIEAIKSDTKLCLLFTVFPCIKTCIKCIDYLFVFLVAVPFVGVLITKAYLPVVIMKAQLLCGMLSQDPKLDPFR